jgi:hypothetical protein
MGMSLGIIVYVHAVWATDTPYTDLPDIPHTDVIHASASVRAEKGIANLESLLHLPVTY